MSWDLGDKSIVLCYGIWIHIAIVDFLKWDKPLEQWATLSMGTQNLYCIDDPKCSIGESQGVAVDSNSLSHSTLAGWFYPFLSLPLGRAKKTSVQLVSIK